MQNRIDLRKVLSCFSIAAWCFCCTTGAHAATPAQEQVKELLLKESPGLLQLYRELHQHPELSLREEKTSDRVAAELEIAGFQVTRNVGGFGVVGVLSNGPGQTVLLRADMDGLPVREQTGLPYASKATQTVEGKETPVMHACGHDIHMTWLIGAARVLSAMKNHWHGTLVLIGQPAEEAGDGAKAMLAAGLFQRFPMPNVCLALHDNAETPAGTVSHTPGYSSANVDSVEIVVHGVGGHGAYPHKTKDPVVLASRIVLALQTIVSREVRPGEPAVVTVGSIHGGTRNNIIPDEVRLQLTIRSYADETRKQLVAAIRRIARGEAIAAGLPEELLPEVKHNEHYTPSLFNDLALGDRLVGTFRSWLGETNVLQRPPSMGGEDFSEYGRTDRKIPICMFDVGAVNPEFYQASRTAGTPLPSLHSPLFAPDPEPTIRTGITVFSASVLELLKAP